MTLVETRVQTWEYKGGYRKRIIDLKVNQKGDLTQSERILEVRQPESAVSGALLTKVEGWDVPQELRVLVQITPENAPFVVASVGDLKKVEERVLTPAIRSVLRNVVGGSIRVPTQVVDSDGNPLADDSGEPLVKTVTRPTVVLDLIENRGVLEENVEQQIHPEGLKAGVDIKEVRFGDPVIPPEILLARKREQLAQQMKKAFVQERDAQQERIEAEQARATAARGTS
jgi:regulator of protease activity HflC (stomatin/prohibitin superfamily)